MEFVRQACIVVLLVATAPIVALAMPVGFVPLYLVVAIILCGDWSVSDQDASDWKEEANVVSGLDALEKFANGESK